MGTDGNVVVEGNIMFKVGENSGTTYYTGKELPIYNSETKWYVDKQGMISLEVGEEIAESDNPMLQSWTNNATQIFMLRSIEQK